MRVRSSLLLALMLTFSITTTVMSPTVVVGQVMSDFSVAISPSALSIEQGSFGSATATVASLSDFNSPVQLDVSGMPNGVAASFNPNPVTPPAGGEANSAAYFTVGSDVPAGTYSLILTGSSGFGGQYQEYPFTVTVTSSGPPPDFDVSVSPSSINIQQGSSGSTTLTVSPVGGFSSTVFLSSNGAPSGIDVSLTPDQINVLPGSSPHSTVSVAVGSTVLADTYSITLTGSATAGGTPHSCTLSVVVASSGPSPDFGISVTPSSMSVQQGSHDTTILTVAPIGNFLSTVFLSSSGAPSGVDVFFLPSDVTLSPGSSPYSTVTVTVSSTASTGTYSLSLIGTTGNGGLAHECTLNLVVTSSGPSPDFSISVSPSSITVRQGNSGSSTLKVTAIGSFSSTVFLSSGSTPSGISASFSPNQITIIPGASPNSVVSVTVGSKVSVGTYSIALIGATGAGQSHECGLTLVITSSGSVSDFAMTVSPNSASVQPGGSVSATVTLTSIGGFSSPIILSTLGSSPGLSLTFAKNPLTPTSSSSASSSVSVSVASSVKAGTYVLTIRGASGSFQHIAMLNLIVTQHLTPDFSLRSSATSISVSQGGSITLTLLVSSVNGFSSAVSFSATWTGTSPVGVSFVNPASITLHAGETASANLALSASSQASVGSNVLVVTAKSGGLSHSTNIQIQVALSASDFAITIPTPQVTLAPGSHTTLIATVQSTGVFSSAVTFTSLSVKGVSLSYSANPITPPAGNTVTLEIRIEVYSNAPLGDHVITLTGRGGGLSHTASLTLTVTKGATPDFTLAASSSALNVLQGASSSATITVNSQNDFSSDVQLSVSWLSSAPDGVAFTLPSPITPQPGSYASSVLKVTAHSGSSTGTYTLRITARGESHSHTVDVTVQVTGGTSPTTTTAASTSSGPLRCLIATAAFGSELSPEVTFLRGFRDNLVVRTFSGSSFMVVFNAWYYSFSPGVAQIEDGNPTFRAALKVALYPLISILKFGAAIFSTLALNHEVAAVIAGLVISALIGGTYLAIPVVALRSRFKSRRMARRFALYAAVMLAANLAVVGFAEFWTNSALMMISTSGAVLSACTLSSVSMSEVALRLLERGLRIIRCLGHANS